MKLELIKTTVVFLISRRNGLDFEGIFLLWADKFLTAGTGKKQSKG